MLSTTRRPSGARATLCATGALVTSLALAAAPALGADELEISTIAPTAAGQNVKVRISADHRNRFTRIETRLDRTLIHAARSRPGRYAGTRLELSRRVLQGPETLVVVGTTRKGRRVTARREITPMRSSNARRRAPAGSLTVTPRDGARASGRMAIRVQSSKGNRIRAVEVRLNGKVLLKNAYPRGGFSGASTWLETRKLRPGAHKIVVKVFTPKGSVVVRRSVVVTRAAGPARSTGPAAGLAAPAPAAAGPSFGAAPPPQTAPGPVLWKAGFESGDTDEWQGRSGRPSDPQVSTMDRIKIVTSPVAEGRYAARFEVRQGDTWRDSGGNRTELWDQTDESEGIERWYTWSTMFDPSYPRITDGYQIFTQFHSETPTGQPPLSFQTTGDQIVMNAVESDASGNPGRFETLFRAPMDRGRWHQFKLHVRWSASRDKGFVELWHDGRQVVKLTNFALLYPNGARNYIKQGLYRASKIEPTSVVYHDAMTMYGTR